MTRSLASFDIRYSISVSVFFNWHPDLKNSIKVLFRVLIVGYFFFFFDSNNNKKKKKRRRDTPLHFSSFVIESGDEKNCCIKSRVMVYRYD